MIPVVSWIVCGNPGTYFRALTASASISTRSPRLNVLLNLILYFDIVNWVGRSDAILDEVEYCFKKGLLPVTLLSGAFCVEPRGSSGDQNEALRCNDVVLVSSCVGLIPDLKLVPFDEECDIVSNVRHDGTCQDVWDRNPCRWGLYS